VQKIFKEKYWQQAELLSLALNCCQQTSFDQSNNEEMIK
jgi:hypothetical protein